MILSIHSHSWPQQRACRVPAQLSCSAAGRAASSHPDANNSWGRLCRGPRSLGTASTLSSPKKLGRFRRCRPGISVADSAAQMARKTESERNSLLSEGRAATKSESAWRNKTQRRRKVNDPPALLQAVAKSLHHATGQLPEVRHSRLLGVPGVVVNWLLLFRAPIHLFFKEANTLEPQRRALYEKQIQSFLFQRTKETLPELVHNVGLQVPTCLCKAARAPGHRRRCGPLEWDVGRNARLSTVRAAGTCSSGVSAACGSCACALAGGAGRARRAVAGARLLSLAAAPPRAGKTRPCGTARLAPGCGQPWRPPGTARGGGKPGAAGPGLGTRRNCGACPETTWPP